ncbi:MAG: hypothetical protein F6J93_30190 [Oscillatoria sp. SIO1A7]|nr:hypothetical protein [Oscillatoria sp. SIO1A7]
MLRLVSSGRANAALARSRFVRDAQGMRSVRPPAIARSLARKLGVAGDDRSNRRRAPNFQAN